MANKLLWHRRGESPVRTAHLHRRRSGKNFMDQTTDLLAGHADEAARLQAASLETGLQSTYISPSLFVLWISHAICLVCI